MVTLSLCFRVFVSSPPKCDAPSSYCLIFGSVHIQWAPRNNAKKGYKSANTNIDIELVWWVTKHLCAASPSHYLRFQSLILNISADDLCSSVALWPQNPPHPYRTCHCATACVLTENQAIRAKWQFSTHLENKKKKTDAIHSELKTRKILWYVEQVCEGSVLC